MIKLTEEQIIKLIEESLLMKFMYRMDELKEEKRPFGNSGYDSIFKDIKDITNLKYKFEVDDEDELSDLKYKIVDSIFKQIEEWTEKNREKFVVRLNEKEKRK
jgi:hypothetical protein